MKTLILGVDSLIGDQLFKQCQMRGHDVLGTSRRRPLAGPNLLFLDLERVEDFNSLPSSMDLVFLVAAMSKFVACEENPNRCLTINYRSYKTILEHPYLQSSFIVMLSTDAVINRPDSIYAKSKKQLEDHLLQHIPERSTIVRLSKVHAAEFPIVAKNLIEVGELKKAGCYTGGPLHEILRSTPPGPHQLSSSRGHMP